MRNALRLVVASLAAAAAIAVYAGSAGAGAPATNTFTVEKEVTGDVPAGTTFTVEVTCESIFGLTAQAPTPTVITFDAEGDPTSNNVVNVASGLQCTANETVNGGATSTTYACEMTRGNTDQTPPFLGNCVGDDGARFNDVIGDAATITVTNNFPEAPAPITPVAAAVQAPPTFTG